MDKYVINAGIVRMRLIKGASICVLAMAVCLTAAPAIAQDAAAQSESVSEVVVTASRITRNGFDAPTPTTVLSAEDIQRAAPVNIADYVNQVPQLLGSNTPQTTQNLISGGLGGANVLNLRDLGTPRTLVLLDGRRVVGAALTGVVDVNLLPSALISRVDVVTGGASAAWGSDAVAGVVNFVLNTKFTGLEAEAQGGESTYRDAQNEKVALTFGTGFAGDRGHVLISGMSSNAEGVSRVDSRPWFNGNNLVVNPAWAAGNGQPYFLQGSHIGISDATNGGLITKVGPGVPSSLVGTNFNLDGTTSRFTFGQPSGSNLQIGGTYSDYAGREEVIPTVRQDNVYFRTSFDLTGRITAFLESMYGYSKSYYLGPSASEGTGLTNPGLTIHSDNAYLPAAIAAQMPAGSSFTLGRLNFDGGEPLALNLRNTYRTSVGLDGRLGGDWKWDAYLVYGKTEIDNNVYNDAIKANLALSADAVRVTAANVGSSGLTIGSIACRSSLTAPTNGCVPRDVFGYGAPSAAALAYVSGHAEQEITMQQKVAAAQISGTPVTGWAGPVSTVVGLETRLEEANAGADALSATNPFDFGNYHPLAGKYTVTEGFFEADIPLLKDAPLVKLIDLDNAVRFTHYSLSGSVTTWKLGGNWKVYDDLTFRGTRSRDIRAPNLNDLFLGAQSASTTITDPLQGGASTTVLQTTIGNQALKPEVADAYGFGVVFRPSWLTGFGVSVDYYDIEVAKAITTLTAVQIVDFCAQGQTTYCSAVTRNSAGALTAVTVEPFNANSETEKGVDIEASYRSSLEGLHLPGQVGLRLLGTHIRKRTIVAAGVTQNLLGEVALAQTDPPSWKGMFSADYVLGASDTTLSLHYIGSGVVDNTFSEGGNAKLLSIDNNKIGSSLTADLSETYQWHGFQLFAVVENITNAAPPVAVANRAGLQTYPGTAPAWYDLVGRRYRLGVRFRY